ncbi:peptidoglycan-binding domain-containing protein [Roseovarius indicus]|uniref:peptidoglycan-binding domain-containing protein n=1 Tax=Roseovarius indicus TaxID=540747 RepID=UPI0007D9483D|nr:peptidoglycan-binding domain-containing protein [Roseovarius indicus]OAO02344.1 lytic transglycosylase [Roseovarius indicus]
MAANRLFALLICLLAPLSAIADEAALQKELLSLDAQISEVNSTIGRYDGGLIVDLATARREALLLARQLVQNQIAAERGEAKTEIIVPQVETDPEKAKRLLGEIAAAQERVEEAEQEAAEAGGLIQALAWSRAETERLTLAQLNMGYLQAKYGIAFPLQTTPAEPSVSAPAPPKDSASNPVGDAGGPDWADGRYPEIDYSLIPFERASREGHQISGWWTIESESAAIDDSPLITTINYSAYDPNDYGGPTVLLARCSEGETALIFLQSDYLMSDYRSNSFAVTVRLDDQQAQTTRWSRLTNNKGAGLFGAKAEDFLRRLLDVEELFIRLVEKNGEQHDVVFELTGHADAFEAVAAGCGWSTLALTEADHAAIQTLLNAGGFDAGQPDGKWGSGSRAAMKRFQASVGLPETGSPDRATLNKLGFGDQ